ncbi:MAG TPA: thrombospondin, partial [Kaistella sp.]|nr:thrombospondin [Kaistella sp.]
NWPMIRKSAHTALESNTKGFVITRMTTAQITAIVSPQEGMMVYDTVAKCLKLYDGTVWSCFSTPACP